MRAANLRNVHDFFAAGRPHQKKKTRKQKNKKKTIHAGWKNLTQHVCHRTMMTMAIDEIKTVAKSV